MLTYGTYPFSCPLARQLCLIERLYSSGHILICAVLKVTIKETPVFNVYVYRAILFIVDGLCTIHILHYIVINYLLFVKFTANVEVCTCICRVSTGWDRITPTKFQEW